jgi:L-lactate dehydrogenase complex protein LldG
MPHSDVIQQFKEKAEAVQAVVAKINHMDDAFHYTVNLIQEQNGETVVAIGLDAEEQERFKKKCETSNLKLLEFPLRSSLNNIHTSLTVVDWGIAETGTLVLDSSPEDVRIATMLAETHIAVLPATKISLKATDIEVELNAIMKKGAPSYTAFITGASRTADIERVLAIGVHGPQELHVLILEETKHD